MEPTFPNQMYTSIETEELERLRSQASKGSMAPHVFAQMVNRVRDLAFDFGTTEQFRDRVSELLGEYIDPDAKAPSVVVPETDDYSEEVKIVTKHALKDEWPDDGVSEDCMVLVCWGLRIGIRYANSRAIPADRVPGEGQEIVATRELKAYRAWENDDRTEGRDSVRFGELLVLDALDAHRANQGGSTT